MTLERAYREASARIVHRASVLMAKYPDWAVDHCLHVATLEEVALNGVPMDQPAPIGILGCSPIHRGRAL